MAYSPRHLVSPMLLVLALAGVSTTLTCSGAESGFAVEQQSDRVLVSFAGQPVATYVFRDSNIPRPYLAHVHAPNRQRLTRNHPPVEGEDRTDHAELHPGIWLAFGDLSGSDFWRNQASIEHEAFVEPPTADGEQAGFTVRNRYQRADGSTVCDELCRLTFFHSSLGYLLTWDSQFSGVDDFYFGDQEEMGLGFRIRTPLSVEQGGVMLDSEGRRNGIEIWGNSANWCDYSGEVAGQRMGIQLMCHPLNFRPCWMHARDYGFIAANPFGRQAFGKGEPSKIVVKPGETLRLRFGLLLHSTNATDKPTDLTASFANYLQATKD